MFNHCSCQKLGHMAVRAVELKVADVFHVSVEAGKNVVNVYLFQVWPIRLDQPCWRTNTFLMAHRFPPFADLWPLPHLCVFFFFLSLQRQVAGEVQTQPQDRAVNQIAMMLAIMGLSLSYYSAKQMTEKVNAHPAPWRAFTRSGRGDDGRTNDKRRSRESKSGDKAVSFRTEPHSSHLTVTLGHWISRIPHPATVEPSGPVTCFLYFLLSGPSGTRGGRGWLTFIDRFLGGLSKHCWLPTGPEH